MSLHIDEGPDASSALLDAAFDHAVEAIKGAGVEVESLLILVVYKDDHGVSAASAHHDGSVFSSIGCANSWLVDNTVTKR